MLFFALAWQSPASEGESQWRYALISGLLFAGALWTKPTAGSFALGVMLVMGVTAIYLWLPKEWRARVQWFVPDLTSQPFLHKWRGGVFRQKFMLAVVTALACLPIGGMWYVRNVIYGHEAVTFPADYWRNFAQRSGQEFGWLLVIAVLAVGYVLYKKSLFPPVAAGGGIRSDEGLALLGLVTVLFATLPNALYIEEGWTAFSAFEWAFGLRPPSGRLNLREIAGLIAGLTLMAYGLRGYWKALESRLRTIIILMVLLITPFTLVWFYSYSYHARLMLTITPVIASFVAALIEAWIIPAMQKNRARRIVLIIIVVLLCIPGIGIGSWLTMLSTFVDPLHHDEEKYATSNEALMLTVNWLRERQADSNDPLTVYTFGEQRINFFFPENRNILRDEYPTEFDDLRPDTDYLLGGQLTDFLWREQGVYPNQLSAYMALGFTFTRPFLEYGHNIPDSGRPEWTSPLNPQHFANDASTQIIGYAYLSELRFNHPDQIDPPLRLENIHWDLITLHGLDFRSVAPYNTITYFFSPGPAGEGGFPYGHARVPAGKPTFLQLYWQRTGLQPFEKDYVVFIHLRDAETGEIVSQRDGEIPIDSNTPLPTTLLPYPDLIVDRREWMIPVDLEPGMYDLYIGFFDPLTFERLPVYQGETLLGDGILIEDVVEIVPQEDAP